MSDEKSEAQIVREIMLAVGALPGVICYRNGQAMAEAFDEQTGKSRVWRTGLGPGTPDLVLSVSVLVTMPTGAVHIPTGARLGRLVGLECKTLTGKARETQLQVQRQWHDVGAFYAFVRSVDEARAALMRVRNGEVQ